MRNFCRAIILGVQGLYDRHPNVARTVFLVAFIGCFTYSSIHLYRAASVVTDENVYVDSPEGVLITSITRGGASDIAGLQVGDIILEVNGTPVKTAYEANTYIVKGYGGKKLEYTILRGGRKSVYPIVLAAYGLPFASIINLLLSLSCYILAVVVFFARPRDQVARLLGWFMLSFALFMSMSSGYNSAFFPDLFTKSRFLLFPFVWALTLATVTHLVLVFPVRRFDVRYPARLYMLIYGFPLIAAFTWFPVNPGFWYVFWLTTVIVTIGEIFVRRRFGAFRNADFRTRNSLIRIAGWLLVAYMFANGLAQWIPVAQFLLPVILFIPVAYFITIARYSVFGLYFKVRKSLVYSLCLAGLNLALALLCFSMMKVASSHIWDIPSMQVTTRNVELVWPMSLPMAEQIAFQQRLALVFGGVLVMAVLWLHRRGTHFLDEKFYRGTFDFKKALQAFGTFATRFTDTGELAREAVLSICGLLHVKGAALYIIEGDRFRIRADCDQDLTRLPAEFRCDANALEALKARPYPQTLQSSGLAGTLADTGIEFITPVFVRNEPVALLTLMQKHSETSFSREDVELLQYLAGQLTSAFEVIALYDGVKEREHLKREFEIARRIQLSALPAEIPEFPGLDIAVSSIPAYEVGGDFYDLLVSHPHLTIFVGDVSGKGTSAALHLSRIQGMIRVIHSFTTTLWELFVRLNSQAMEQLDRRSFVTLGAVRIDLMSRAATFVRAGHLPLLHYRGLTNDVLLHQPQGMGIGLDDRRLGQTLEESALAPDPGDIFVLMTDGITEAENPALDQFGIDAISSIVRENQADTAEAIRDRILAAVAAFGQGRAPHDDMTLVVVKFAEEG